VLEFANPALVNLVDRNGIEVVELFTSLPLHGDEIGVFEQFEVLGDRLASHVQAGAEFGKRLSVLCVETIDK